MFKKILNFPAGYKERHFCNTSSGYIQMDNLAATDNSQDNDCSDDNSFAIGANSIDQGLFEDDEADLVSPRHAVFSDEELQSPITIRRKPVYDEDMWWKTSELEGLGQYDDFHTIDWCRDRIRDRMRFRHIKKMKLGGTWLQKLKVYK